MAEPTIRLRGLTKLFTPDAVRIAKELRAASDRRGLIEEHRNVLALFDVDLDVARGSVQVVMGLSGSGKSTLVRHINRLIEPTSGRVEIDGEDIMALSARALRDFRRRRMSMVFQRFALLPHRTVLDNVAYGLQSAGADRGTRGRIAHDWIERVGLSGTEQLYPAQLSGGMQQRVGLARALATDADILLMDEAFSALDPLIRTDMQSLLLDLQRDLGRTIVFITHDLDEALRLGDRIAILKDGELIQEATGQEIVLSPANEYVAAFVGDVDRSRVVEVAALVGKDESWSSEVRPTVEIRFDARLRDAARDMAAMSADAAIVSGADGSPIGQVTLRQIVVAMTQRTRLERDTDNRRT